MSEVSLAGGGVIVLQRTEAKRVGSNIRELRQRLGLSLEECARRANVSADYLGRLEQGYELKVEKAVLDTLRQA